MDTYILVIEDDPLHLRDAMEFFKNLPLLKVCFAGNWREIEPFLKNPPIGIISDVTFPLSEEFPEPVQLGTRVIAKFHHERRVPLVLISDRFHHAGDQEWICDWLKTEGLPYIIDGSLELVSNHDQKLSHKNWAAAWRALQEQIEKKRVSRKQSGSS